MKIQWLGHSSFLITADSGTRVIVDPYKAGAFEGGIAYSPINEPADIVTTSHEHDDHGYVAAVKGSPMVIRGAGQFVASGIEFYGVETAHDESGGAERGKNVIFIFTVDGIKLCHLGDLGHILTDDQAAEIGSVDVLMLPVGGYFTIGPDEASTVTDQLSARVVIPMHFKTEKCKFPIAEVDEFIKGKQNVKRLNSSELTLSKDQLPEERTIFILQHAR